MRLLGAEEADWAAKGLRDHAEEDGLELGTGMGVAKGETDPVPPLVATAKGLGDDFKRSKSNWWWYEVTGAGAPIRPCKGRFLEVIVNLNWLSAEGNDKPSARFT